MVCLGSRGNRRGFPIDGEGGSGLNRVTGKDGVSAKRQDKEIGWGERENRKGNQKDRQIQKGETRKRRNKKKNWSKREGGPRPKTERRLTH